MLCLDLLIMTIGARGEIIDWLWSNLQISTNHGSNQLNKSIVGLLVRSLIAVFGRRLEQIPRGLLPLLHA